MVEFGDIPQRYHPLNFAAKNHQARAFLNKNEKEIEQKMLALFLARIDLEGESLRISAMCYN